MVVTVEKERVDLKCKLPHALVADNTHISVECVKGMVDLKSVCSSIDGCTYLDGKDYQKVLFKWDKFGKFCSNLNGQIILYHHPGIAAFIQTKKKEAVSAAKVKEEADRRRKVEEKKKEVAAKFEMERNTCLIAGDLYKYQNDGVIFLQINRNVILADDMGLGKTVETIEFLLREKRDGRFTSAMIVVPASLKSQWKDEIERFCGDRFSVTIIDGNCARRETQWKSGSDIFICNYDSLVNDVDYGYLEGIKFSHGVLDEASYIKNHEAKRSISIKKVMKDVPSRIALTGTPLENDIDELWSIMEFVNPKVFGSFEDFKKDYKVLRQNGNGKKHYYVDMFKKVTAEEYKKTKVDKLRKKLLSVMVRRRKAEVLDQLPPLTKMRETVTLDVPAREIHDEMYKEMKDLLKEFTGLMKKNPAAREAYKARITAVLNMIRTKFVFLRELCLMPSLIIPNEPVLNVKLLRLKEILDDISEGSKVVIFTEFRRVALMLNKEIPNSLVVHGQIDKMKRPAIIAEFKNSVEKNVIISTSVLTYGVNLQFANYIINYDLHFNPAKMSQRIDRLHRIGQTRGVTVLNLIAENSIEERVEQILVKKHDIFCSIVEGKSVDANFIGESFVSSLAEVVRDGM